MDIIIQKLNLKKDNYYSRAFLTNDMKGFCIYPHPDTALKLMTMQFPLCENNDYAKDFGMQLCTKKDNNYSKVKRMHFKKNTMWAFKTTHNSYHTVDHLKYSGRIQAMLSLYYISGGGPVNDSTGKWRL